MSLRTRLFIEHPFEQGATISLSEEQSHYLTNVLRSKANEQIRIFNGIDGEWQANIISLTKKQVIISLTHQIIHQREDNSLHFAFCPIKAVTPSFIVQKATELGVTDIWPLISKRTIINKINLEKLHKSAIEAAEQSERLIIPKIHPLQKLSQFIKDKTFKGQLIFCYEKNESSRLESLKSKLERQGNCILIGPEGGFSQEEAQLIKTQKYTVTINFGHRIMRAETASIAAISCYNTVMENWK